MRYAIGTLSYDSDYLIHDGVKGMHWGSNRWWTPDHKLTPEGRKHYGYGESRQIKTEGREDRIAELDRQYRKAVKNEFHKNEAREEAYEDAYKKHVERYGLKGKDDEETRQNVKKRADDYDGYDQASNLFYDQTTYAIANANSRIKDIEESRHLLDKLSKDKSIQKIYDKLEKELSDPESRAAGIFNSIEHIAWEHAWNFAESEEEYDTMIEDSRAYIYALLQDFD